MSLTDPPADKPDKSRAMAFTIAALALVAIVALWYTFRYYPEKRAAERFFDALVAGDTAKAYQLWKPGSSYSMKDFLADWGPQGYYGPVKSYKVIRAKAPSSSNAVAVSVGSQFRRRAELGLPEQVVVGVDETIHRVVAGKGRDDCDVVKQD